MFSKVQNPIRRTLLNSGSNISKASEQHPILNLKANNKVLSFLILRLKQFKMYPRVKVRAYEQDDCLSPQNNSKVELFFTPPESLSTEAKENGSSWPLPIARILKAHMPDHSTKQLSSASKAENSRPLLVKNAKPIVRACSVPRPRAVLSSPDNDGMIGSRNKLMNERRSVLKTHSNSREEKEAAQTKLSPIIRKVKSEKPLKLAETFEKAIRNKSDQREIQEPALMIRS